MTDAPSVSTRPDPASSAQRERVGMLQSDRPCITCAYNLIGQDIVRDPHYNLAIIRCPECGTATTVQEYPLLGPWANRLNIVFGLLWALLLLGLLGGTIAASTGLGFGMREGTVDSFSTFVAQQYIDEIVEPQRIAAENAAAAARNAAGDQADGASDSANASDTESESESDTASDNLANVIGSTPGLDGLTFTGDPAHDELVNLVINLSTQVDSIRLRQRVRTQNQLATRASPWMDVDGPWWRAQDPASIVARAGGWWAATDRAVFFWILLAVSAVSVLLGMVWSNMLIHLDRRWLILVAFVLLAPAMAIHYTVQLDELESLATWTSPYARRIGASHLGFTTVKVYFACFFVFLSMSMFVGRPLLRGIIRVFMPPKLRAPLASLWLAAGKTPPAGHPAAQR